MTKKPVGGTDRLLGNTMGAGVLRHPLLPPEGASVSAGVELNNEGEPPRQPSDLPQPFLGFSRDSNR